MAKVLTSKSGRPPKLVGGVAVISGNSIEFNTFKQARVGHEYALPDSLPDGTRVLRTPSGKTFKTKKMSS
jgi:hypothetical protein